ncbi:MAG TPA: histidine kinase [Spirochaetaceae bacterium]|nr:histidine kinase [Spirochaetaceae bacterium]
MNRSSPDTRHHSIQVSMALAFSIIAVSIIVGAILIAFSLTEETARIASRRYTQQLVNQVAANIDSYIDYMDSVSVFVQADRDVQEFLGAPSAERRGRAGPGASALLSTLVRSRKDISLVAVFDYEGGFISDDPEHRLNPFAEPARQSWFGMAQKESGRSVISSSHVQNVILDRYIWVISLSREILDSRSGLGSGVLLVDLNFDVIERICSSIELGKRGYIFIVDRNGEIVYHPQQQLIYGGLKSENIPLIVASADEYFTEASEGSDLLYSIKTMGATGWKVVGVNYRSELVENRDTIRRTYAFWGLAFFIIAILLSMLVSQRISKPIKLLRKSMQAVERGDFDVQADIGSANEIGELGKDFNIMTSEIKLLLHRITEQQEQKRKSELKALQMQINPHFLYNTLDSIIWMAEGKKQQEVIAMSSALARLFRLSISRGKEVIDIASEVEHVSNYLTIQKIRYKDKLDYRLEVPEELKGYRTVKIILQPLVENAIYHGIKNKAGTGIIIIAGVKTADGIELSVRDDGVGMDDVQLTRLRATLAGGEPDGGGGDYSPHSGLGVRNVDERIKLYFGPGYGLSYESEEDGGTIVRVRLPAIIGESEL